MSEQAYDSSPGRYDYAQTKAATKNFVKSIAKQLGPRKYVVNGVAPGPVWTPLQISGGAQPKNRQGLAATARSAAPANALSSLLLRSARFREFQLYHRQHLWSRRRSRSTMRQGAAATRYNDSPYSWNMRIVWAQGRVSSPLRFGVRIRTPRRHRLSDRPPPRLSKASSC